MRASVLVLALCMLLTGTINTIATKYQDIIVIGKAPDGTPLTFKHPAVQSACMFLGESLCLIPYFIMRWRRRRAKRQDPGYVPMPAQEKRSRRISRILAFAVPTLCDATGSSLMNIGLFYTYASAYQMLRGTLVLFAGAFTVLILRRQLFIHHWLGMVLITAGAALVGASSVIYAGSGSSNTPSLSSWGAAAATAGARGGWGGAVYGSSGSEWAAMNATAAGLLHYDPGVSRVASRGMLGMHSFAAAGTSSSIGSGSIASSGSSSGSGWTGALLQPLSGLLRVREGAADTSGAPLFGDLLVVGAQAFTALQFILEEKYLVKYKVPALLAVGLEGCWGLVLCGLLLPVTTVVKGPDGIPLDDAAAAFKAMLSNAQLGGAVVLSIFSIAFFNFFGVSVTKSLSGAARATIDACRTLFIWLYALHAGWETFHALEVVGFVVLISGTSLYNEILKSCLPGTSSIGGSGRQSPLPRHSHSRQRGSGATAAGTGDRGVAGQDMESSSLLTPLLAAAAGAGETKDDAAAAPAEGAAANGAAALSPQQAAAAGAGLAAGVAAGAAAAGALRGADGDVAGASRGRGAPPVPLRRPAPAHMRRGADAAQSSGASGSWGYHMARSMRLGIHTLSPQSLAAAGGLAGDDVEGGSDGDDESDTASSSYYSSYLSSSLSRSIEGTGGGGLGGRDSWTARGGAPAAAGAAGAGSSSGGRGVSWGPVAAAQPEGFTAAGGVPMVLRGFESPGAAGEGGGGGGVRGPGVGGLAASLQAAAGAGGGGDGSSSRPRPAAAAAGGGSGMPPRPQTPAGSGLRRSSSSGATSSQQQ